MSGTILITGASSGIGAETARLFLREGWTVGLLARRADLLEEVAVGMSQGRFPGAGMGDPGMDDLAGLGQIHGGGF